MAITYDPIATVNATGSISTLTFNSIPSTYTDLRLVIRWLSAGDFGWYAIRFNGDTGTNYNYQFLRANYNGTVAGASSLNQNEIPLASNENGAGTTIPAFGQVDIFSYTDSVFKTVLSWDSAELNGNTAGRNSRTVGMWKNTNAVTSMSIVAQNWNFVAGTTATLYGIARA